MKSLSVFHKRLTLFGFGMGIFFPILSLTIDLLIKSLPLKITSLKVLFSQNPIQWIIICAPIILGGTFYYLGKLIVKRELKLEEYADLEKGELKNIEIFIKKLEAGDYNLDTKQLRNESIASALTNFQNQFKANKEIDARRTWSAEGLANFSELLRNNSNDLKDLCDKMVTAIANYVKANQAALFLVNDSNKENYLELVSTYAYKKNQIYRQKN